MGNKLNPFEQELRNSLQKFEVDYDHTAWEEMSKKLDASGAGSTSGASGASKLIWAAAGVAVVATSLWISLRNNDHTQEETSTIKTELVKPDETGGLSGKDIDNNLVTQQKTLENHTNTEHLKHSKADMPSGKTEEVKTKATGKKMESPVVREDLPSERKPQNKPHKQEPAKPVNSSIKELPMIKAERTTMCYGDTFKVNFVATPQTDIFWDFGDNQRAGEATVAHVYSQPGRYTVEARATANPDVVTNSIEVIVNPRPDAAFEFKSDLDQGVVPVVRFAAQDKSSKAYFWNFGDGHVGSGKEIDHTYTKKGDYEVSLRVINKFGCNWTRYNRITNTRAYNLLAPNSFSPNGDGVNDTWLPKALETGLYDFTLHIYNRNNQLIYETKDANLPWDGKVSGTLSQPGDVFIWRATVQKSNGAVEQYMGTIVVM